MRYFVAPPVEAFQSSGHTHYGKYASYAEYNYLRPGLVSSIKRRRFEVALALAQAWFGSDVIDMGTADGILIPSLAARFSRVVAVDVVPYNCSVAERVAAPLRNVTVICNEGLSFADLRIRIGYRAQAMFILETLEHVGEKGRMYESKVEFVRQCFTLLAEDGVIIASVPRMTGVLFMAKYFTQSALRMHHEPMTFREVLRSGLGDTSQLESRWEGQHVGFNENKLADALMKEFRVVIRKTMTSYFYVIKRRA